MPANYSVVADPDPINPEDNLRIEIDNISDNPCLIVVEVWRRPPYQERLCHHEEYVNAGVDFIVVSLEKPDSEEYNHWPYPETLDITATGSQGSGTGTVQVKHPPQGQ